MNTIISFFATPLGYLLKFLYEIIGNYGLAIMALTFVVKACLYPLYLKQVMSTGKMGDLQPKMKALQRQYANDKQTLNVKMAELYKEEKVNPVAGCLPMLIQMPIIFGLFALLRNPIAIFPDSGEMLFAAHEAFLWITDLSQPDKWILPILAGIATFISFSQTQKQTAGAGNQMGMQGMQAMMKYFFPMMIVLMARFFPAGLSIYWFFGQVVQIGFNFHLNKVRREIREGKKKGKKGKK